MEAYAEGYVNGMSATTFEPDTKVTRGMIVTMLYRMAGEPATDAENSFSDVAADSYYHDAVVWANENEIALGFGDGTFCPDQTCTREQMVVFLYRYIKFQGGDVSATAELNFPDADKVSSYAEDAIKWAVAEGIINGVKISDTVSELQPQGTATRAQFAAIITR